MLQNITYDCILLDLKMPRMNGQKLYQLIQGSSEALADKVIFMSGDTVTSTTYDFVSSTGNRLLNKPFQIADLRTQVGQLIKQSLGVGVIHNFLHDSTVPIAQKAIFAPERLRIAILSYPILSYIYLPYI